jgi:hypothetical protein
MMESGPLDLDLTARSKGYAGSSLDRSSRSDGLHLTRARGGGAGSPEWFPTAVHGLGSLDFAYSGAPVFKSSRAWVCRDQRDTHDPPGAKAGLGGALDCARGGRGGPARRRTPACGVLI